jgi:hypothetical protein
MGPDIYRRYFSKTLDQGVPMKKFLALLALICLPAMACDIEPIRKQVKEYYSHFSAPVQIGNKTIKTKTTNVKVAENLLLAKYERFLVVTFDLHVGKEIHPMTTLANVDSATCSLETFNSGDTFGSSIR